MTLKRKLLGAGAAMSVMFAGCAQLGIGDQAGCRTIYVFRPAADGGGAIQPVSSCGGLPRDSVQAMASADAAPLDLATEDEADDADEGEEGETRAVTPVSAAALATRPAYPPIEPYPGANEMLENGDMAAFMARVREDYAAGRNTGAWGYVVIDALAAGDTPFAQDVIDAMAAHPTPEMLSINHLRAWVMAFAGRAESAHADMARQRRLFPAPVLLGHRALLAEGLGQTELALAIYDEAPDAFDAPKPEEASSPTYLARIIAFNGQRILALRQAELLRAVDREDEAVALLTRLLAATPDDRYVARQLELARAGAEVQPVRTLPQAMAQALADEAAMIEERQDIMGLMVGRGASPPFNHLIGSLRQSALLLDPDNGDIRLAEVNQLYDHGHFEAALRIAQIGDPKGVQRAGLASAAGLAALELGSPETLLALTDRALEIEGTAEARLAAAGALIPAGYTDRAIRLADEALRRGLPESQRVFALMTKAQASFQAGDIAGAIGFSREALTLGDADNTRQFLASMLVKSPDRPEGLQIMRDLLADAPGNVGLMNNLGYSLVDGHVSADELDEGFTMLKEASRISPDEPNLLDSLGWAYYHYGDFREALRYIELAIEAYKPFDHYELLDHLGDIRWRLEEPDLAREAWAAALEARPPEHDRERIAAKLEAGPAEPAPERRDTPEVPLNRNRGDTSDI